jgi:hypothetical protein
MAHRAKHLRRNWIPERKAAAEKRAEAEGKRRNEAIMRRTDAEVAAMIEAQS